MKKSQCIIFFVLITFITKIHAQGKLKADDGFDLKGKVSGYHWDGDTISLYYMKRSSQALKMSAGGVVRCFTAVIHNGRFEFSVPKVEDFSYVSLELAKHHNKLNREVYDLSTLTSDYEFVIQKGDKILLSISKSNVFFRGVNSEKYNYQLMLDSIEKKTSSDDKILFSERYNQFNKIDTVEQLGFIYSYERLTRICIERGIKVFDKYRSKMDDEIFRLINFNYITRNWARFFTYINIAFITDNAAGAQIFVRQNYLKWDDNNWFGIPKVSDEEILKSNSFSTFALAKEHLKARCDPGYGNLASSIGYYYNKIVKSYSGKCREKIIVDLFARNIEVPADSTDFYLDKAILSMRQKDLLDILVTNVKGRFSKGSPIYDFQLENSEGKVISLDYFKGKVVVFDFWFTGCENCAYFHSSMKPVMDEFRNNNNVVFVSICQDRDKSRWINSLKKNIYTDDSEVNLYTSGKGDNHPLLEYYGFHGGPYFFIGDKDGKILNAYLKAPDFDIQSGKTGGPKTDAFIKVIRDYLIANKLN